MSQTVSSAEAARAVTRASTRATRRLRSVADAKLTITQVSALTAIAAAGELTLGELATVERVQPPSMTRIVAGLLDDGLITRRADPDDGRQVLVALTGIGSDVLSAESSRREQWLAERLEGLSDDERKLLLSASNLLIRLMDE